MGYSNIEIVNDPLEGELLIAQGERRKGGAYIARIVGLDKKYKYAREFISERENDWKSGIVTAKVPLSDLSMPWDLLEIRAGGSWKNDYRGFYLYDAIEKDVETINEKVLREKLAETLKPTPIQAEHEKKVERRIKV